MSRTSLIVVICVAAVVAFYLLAGRSNFSGGTSESTPAPSRHRREVPIPAHKLHSQKSRSSIKYARDTSSITGSGGAGLPAAIPKSHTTPLKDSSQYPSRHRNQHLKHHNSSREIDPSASEKSSVIPGWIQNDYLRCQQPEQQRSRDTIDGPCVEYTQRYRECIELRSSVTRKKLRELFEQRATGFVQSINEVVLLRMHRRVWTDDLWLSTCALILEATRCRKRHVFLFTLERHEDSVPYEFKPLVRIHPESELRQQFRFRNDLYGGGGYQRGDLAAAWFLRNHFRRWIVERKPTKPTTTTTTTAKQTSTTTTTPTVTSTTTTSAFTAIATTSAEAPQERLAQPQGELKPRNSNKKLTRDDDDEFVRRPGQRYKFCWVLENDVRYAGRTWDSFFSLSRAVARTLPDALHDDFDGDPVAPLIPVDPPTREMHNTSFPTLFTTKNPTGQLFARKELRVNDTTANYNNNNVTTTTGKLGDDDAHLIFFYPPIKNQAGYFVQERGEFIGSKFEIADDIHQRITYIGFSDLPPGTDPFIKHRPLLVPAPNSWEFTKRKHFAGNWRTAFDRSPWLGALMPLFGFSTQLADFIWASNMNGDGHANLEVSLPAAAQLSGLKMVTAAGWVNSQYYFAWHDREKLWGAPLYSQWMDADSARQKQQREQQLQKQKRSNNSSSNSSGLVGTSSADSVVITDNAPYGIGTNQFAFKADSSDDDAAGTVEGSKGRCLAGVLFHPVKI